MRFVAKLLSLVPVVAGLGLLGFAVARYRLPYENQRYFDPRTETVYHFETAEVLLIAAIVLIVAGLAIAGSTAAFLRSRERREKS
jgi:predicted alpha/beta-hydrolase family hydrolase